MKKFIKNIVLSLVAVVMIMPLSSATAKTKFRYAVDGGLHRKTIKTVVRTRLVRQRARTVYVKKRSRSRTVFVRKRVNILKRSRRNRTVYRTTGLKRTVYVKKRIRSRTRFVPVRRKARVVRVRTRTRVREEESYD